MMNSTISLEVWMEETKRRMGHQYFVTMKKIEQEKKFRSLSRKDSSFLFHCTFSDLKCLTIVLHKKWHRVVPKELQQIASGELMRLYVETVFRPHIQS
jgi:hypothetical protein